MQLKESVENGRAAMTQLVRGPSRRAFLKADRTSNPRGKDGAPSCDGCANTQELDTQELDTRHFPQSSKGSYCW